MKTIQTEIRWGLRILPYGEPVYYPTEQDLDRDERALNSVGIETESWKETITQKP